MISDDGETVLTGSVDHTVRVWNVNERQKDYVFDKHGSKITAISLCEEKNIAVSGDASGTVFAWDYKKKKIIKQFECGDKRLKRQNRIIGGFLIHDNTQLITGNSTGCIQIWDFATENLIKEINHNINASLTCMTISHDEKSIVLGTYHWNIYLLDIETGCCKQMFGRHTDRVSAVVLYQDSERLISSSWDKTIRIWDLYSGECEKTLGRQTNCVVTASMSADGQHVAVGLRNGAINIWNTRKGVCEKYYRQGRGTILSISIDEHGKYLASGSWDGSVRVWNCTTDESKLINDTRSVDIGLPVNSVGAIAISSDGSYVLSGDSNGTICFWSRKSGELNYELIYESNKHNNRIKSVSINDVGNKGASVDWDRVLYIWDLGKVEGGKRFDIVNEPATSITMNKDGSLIAIGSYDAHTISVINTDSGECICKLGQKKQYVRRILSVDISADGKTIVSGSREKRMSVWNVDDGSRKFSPKKHKGRVLSVSISADGLHAVSIDSENNIYLWNLQNCECTHKIEPFVDYHLIGVDLRGAHFESDRLKEKCRQNGAIVD